MDIRKNASKKYIKKPSTKALTSKPIKTATKVESIGHLYALVIVQNRGREPGEIQSALYTLVDHLKEKHNNCPFSTNSWCYYQNKLALIAEDASIPTPILRHPYLASDEITRLKDVFQKCASIDMCSATLGMTQNSNESHIQFCGITHQRATASARSHYRFQLLLRFALSMRVQ